MERDKRKLACSALDEDEEQVKEVAGATGKRRRRVPARLHDAAEWEKVMDAPQLLRANATKAKPERQSIPREDEGTLSLLETAGKESDEDSSWGSKSVLRVPSTSECCSRRSRRQSKAPARLHDDSEWEKVMNAPQLKAAKVKYKPSTTSTVNAKVSVLLEEEMNTGAHDNMKETLSLGSDREPDAQKPEEGRSSLSKGRPKRQTRAPARLHNDSEWEKVMDGPQFMTRNKAPEEKRLAALESAGADSFERKIGVLWNSSTGPVVYYGVVPEYDEERREHLVYYDDGEVQYQNLREEELELSLCFPQSAFDAKGRLGYKEAQIFICFLRFASVLDLKAWLKSRYKPAAIPTRLDTAYKGSGFESYEDFINSSRAKSCSLREIRSSKIRCGRTQKKSILEIIEASGKHRTEFERMRKYARDLELKTPHTWTTLYDRGKLKKGAPRDPALKYGNCGWVSWCDFLSPLRWQSYYLAKDFASSLHLRSRNEWEKYCELMKMPLNIPPNPHEVYKDHWLGWSHFLGLRNNTNNNKNARKTSSQRLKMMSEHDIDHCSEAFFKYRLIGCCGTRPTAAAIGILDPNNNKYDKSFMYTILIQMTHKHPIFPLPMPKDKDVQESNRVLCKKNYVNYYEDPDNVRFAASEVEEIFRNERRCLVCQTKKTGACGSELASMDCFRRRDKHLPFIPITPNRMYHYATMQKVKISGEEAKKAKVCYTSTTMKTQHRRTSLVYNEETPKCFDVQQISLSFYQ